MKIQLITGETVDIDIDDYLAMDFTTPEGKAACQDILNFRDFVKNNVKRSSVSADFIQNIKDRISI